MKINENKKSFGNQLVGQVDNEPEVQENCDKSIHYETFLY